LKRMRPHEKRVKSDRAKKMQKVIRKKHQVTQMKQQPKLERPVIAEPEDLMDYDAYMDDVRQLLEPVLTNTPEKRIMKRMEGLRAKGFKPGEYVARHNIKTTEAPTRGKHIRFEDSKPKKTRQDKKTKAELRREKRHKKKQKKKEDKMKKRKVKALAKQKLKLKEANFRSKFDLMKSIIEKLQMELKDQAPLAENEIPVVMQAIERGDWKSTSMTPLQRRIAGIIQSVISKQPKLKDEIAEDTSEELKEDSLSLEYIPGPHRRALEPDEISNEISDLSKSEVEEKEEEPQIKYDFTYRTDDGQNVCFHLEKDSLQGRRSDKTFQRQMDRWRKGMSTDLNAGQRPRLEDVPYTKDEAAESLESDNSNLLGPDYMSNFVPVKKEHVEAEDAYHFNKRMGMKLPEFLRLAELARQNHHLSVWGFPEDTSFGFLDDFVNPHFKKPMPFKLGRKKDEKPKLKDILLGLEL